MSNIENYYKPLDSAAKTLFSWCLLVSTQVLSLFVMFLIVLLMVRTISDLNVALTLI